MENKDAKIVQATISKKKSVPLIILSICFFLTGVFLWQQGKIDDYIIVSQNDIFSHSLIITSARFFSKYGMGIISFLLAIQLILFQSKNNNQADRVIFFYIIISFVTASIAGDLLKEVFNRARPVYELSNQIVQTEINSSPSFPSGHATKSMALALSFIIMMSNSGKTRVLFKILAFITALLVCYSRIALQKHYLGDILAGTGTALFFLVPSVFIVNLIFKHRNITESKLYAINKRIVIIFFGLSVLLTLI